MHVLLLVLLFSFSRFHHLFLVMSNPFLLGRYLEPSNPIKMPSHGYTSKVRVLDRYKVVGFISSGTYGRVYKAVGYNGQSGEFAIKK